MSQGATETEIKLAVPDARAARRLLRAAGFRVHRRRVFETNLVFDTAALELRAARKLLRVRRAGKVVTVTYKGAPVEGKYKSREEIELAVDDAAQMGTIFDRLGYRPVFRYDKYRTEFKQARGGGMATVDETPIGTYVELEGAPEWIDRAARRLGFDESQYITASYGRLYLDWRRERGLEPADMVFEA